MPDTASPTNVLPKSDPDAIKSEQDAPQAYTNGDGVLKETMEGQNEARVEASATNNHEPPSDSTHDDERPAKRRRTRDSTPPPTTPKKIKPISPPWKKFSADGPTSFINNGRRKSGRIHTLAAEPEEPSKTRSTRHSTTGADSKSSKPKADIQVTNGNSRKMPNASHKASPAIKSSSKQTPASTPKSASKKPSTENRTSSRSTRRPSPSRPSRISTGSRRSARFSDVNIKDDAVQESRQVPRDVTTRSPRIKLRVGRSGDIPLVHPHQVPKRPKIGTSFEDFWARGGDIPVEEGGLQASEDGPQYTDEMAGKDARTILRIEEEVNDGGMLSQGRCSIFLPEAEEDPPRQWARQDHMLKAMMNFRKLMLAEQQRHRLTAKKIAEACRDEWLRRQPKSEEEIEAEQRAIWISRYRVVVRALSGTWDNVCVEVNRRRLAEWEQEEQKRVKAALNQAVSLSEQKLQARQAGLDSEQLSDEEDGFDDLSDDMSLAEEDDEELGLASGEDEENENGDDADSDIMSSDEDEADEEDNQQDLGDEDLTQEQLRAKYAHVPDLEKPLEEAEMPMTEPSREDTDAIDTAQATGTENAETSDESVDMDDDLGSSDMESGEEAEDDDSGEESEDDARGGLLGLLFDKSELKKMSDQATTEASVALDEDDEMPDATEDASAPKVNGEGEQKDGEALAEKPEPKRLSLAHSDTVAHVFGEQAVADTTNVSVVTEVPSKVDKTTPDDNEVLMTGIDAGQPNGQSASTSALPEKHHSPATEPATNPPSRAHSMSPPATSETKPSELDTASSAEMAVDKAGASRSASPQHSSNHKIEVPFLLRGTLREYQRDGLDWLAGLYANNTNGILADEMGLGKTIQTIALLAHLACQHEVWGPHLVVVPTSVMLNWEMEFKKWCPGFKILAYYGSQEERKRKRQGWNNDDVWNVCITSYQLVLQDQQVFKRRRWHYMILDEAHNIKNFKSQRWQTLLGFNTQARLLLTGTPLQNNLTELWSLLFFLMPAQNGVGGFADLQEFHDWFQKPESQILESGREQMDDEARAIISKLHKVLRPYLLRRLKADVEKQMPAKYEHVEFCRLSKRQRELYDGFLSRTDTKETLNSGNYLSIINCLMQLRKVCNHPDLFVDRPIMTSFRMPKSVVSDYGAVDQKVQKLLLDPSPMKKVSLSFLNLVPTQCETISTTQAERVSQLSAHRGLMDLREAQRARAQSAYTNLDPSTVASTIAYLESGARWGRFEELQHCVYLNALRRQKKPIYGKNVIELLTIGTDKRPYKPRPKAPRLIMGWFEEESTLIHSLIPTVNQRADSFKTTIEKFSCVTPAVVTRDMDQIILGHKGVEAFTDEDLKLSAPVRWAPFLPKEAPPDPWHEGRMRLSIQFPDKRLLQYDCGKLQILDKLLRKLQAGGHRALIFTQMTKVLDILEQFLNIHGHKYLRLDGATKVEQRQILTDRFNHDPRILCFILSTRSGGLGINLTGADTVIFYDQDWNPAMDKQCQDRCHRIGQTRDVHIYRLVSEHTIEANILRKASQKQMLDDVVIQEGEFTTDYLNKLSVRDVLGDKLDSTSEGLDAADAALDRVLGGPDSSTDQRRVGRALEQAEDREDVAAARVAEKEIQADDADFTEKPSNNASGTSTARQGTPAGKSVLDGGLDDIDTPQAGEDVEYNARGDKMRTIDDYMLSIMAEQLKDTKLELPKDKKGKKKGKDTRKR
ncbi:hypothetical protein F66182_6035 [Fusarium sp. NRRL 66182]|nr:hypothetical protein F66182_6035 [Fusarium sp. NRRL 66182]